MRHVNKILLVIAILSKKWLSWEMTSIAPWYLDSASSIALIERKSRWLVGSSKIISCGGVLDNNLIASPAQMRSPPFKSACSSGGPGVI